MNFGQFSLQPSSNLLAKRLHLRWEVRQPLAFGRNEELVEVPAHLGVGHAVEFLMSKPGIDRVLASALDVDLFRQGEGDAVVQLAEAGDLFFGAGFLAQKLVAGEADDNELVLVFVVQFLQRFVLRREAAFGGDVDAEHVLAFEVAHVHRIAVDTGDAEVVKGMGQFFHVSGCCVAIDRAYQGDTEYSE